MDKKQVAALLVLMAGVDGRIVSEESVTAWHDAIAHLDAEHAREALSRARREPNVAYLEPKHIIAFAARVKEEQRLAAEREARRQKHPEEDPDRYLVFSPGGDVRNTAPAPKPKNFDAMTQAYQSDDPVRIAKERAIYHDQLRSIGFDMRGIDPEVPVDRAGILRKRNGMYSVPIPPEQRYRED